MRPAFPLALCLALALPALADAKVLDLSKRHEGQSLRNFLDGLAQGNEGDAEIKKLTFDTASGALDGEVKVIHRHSWGEVRNPLTGTKKKIYAYQLTQSAKFGFNFKKGTGHFSLDLGRGVKLDTKRIERLLKGDLESLAEWIPNAGLITGESKNDYEHIKRSYEEKYGKGNVYFASKRFVDWAKPTTAGKWVLKAVATSGADAVRTALQECKTEALKEAKEVGAWLQKKGAREAQGAARAMLTGEKITWPYLAIKWQTVGYWSRKKIAGGGYTPWIRETHAAFVLIWRPITPSGGGTASDGTASDGEAVAHEKHQAVVAFKNDTKLTINYQMRWTPTEPWKNYSLKPGESRWYWTTRLPAPQVKFDFDLSKDKEYAQYNLRFNYIKEKPKPALGDARVYTFKREGETLTLNRPVK